MNFVPVTGPATFRLGEPPRDSVVEFTDARRSISLPLRAALPVLTRATQSDEVHPSVGLLAGAAFLGMRLVAAGKFEPAPGGATGWRCSRRPVPMASSTPQPPRGWYAGCSTPWST